MIVGVVTYDVATATTLVSSSWIFEQEAGGHPLMQQTLAALKEMITLASIYDRIADMARACLSI